MTSAPRALRNRAGRFIARVDAHLPTLCDDATRRAFLDRQLEGWEHRYARFLATEGASEPAADPADPPQAADYLLAITALAARRGALGGS
jgi:aminoglycoside phosphotransferase (APT) family kinase protein